MKKYIGKTIYRVFMNAKYVYMNIYNILHKKYDIKGLGISKIKTDLHTKTFNLADSSYVIVMRFLRNLICILFI